VLIYAVSISLIILPLAFEEVSIYMEELALPASSVI
jgi:hypothetical protein